MKFLVAMLLALAVCGCNDPLQVVDEKGNERGVIARIEFEGHYYLIRSDAYQGGMCHDPDCPCVKERCGR